MEMKTVVFVVVLSVGVLSRPEDTQGSRGEIVCESGKPADVAFFLDTSNSIWRPNFRTMLRFVQEVVEFFVIGPDNIHVAAATFGDSVFRHFSLNRYNNKQKIQHAIGQIRHWGSIKTHTNQALEHAFKRTFTERGGARPGVTKVAIFITDGRSHDQEVTKEMARQARSHGIHVFAIGVGFNIDETELKSIASQPQSEYMFMVDDFVGLTKIKDLLAIKTCEVTDPPTTTTTTTTTTPTTPTTSFPKIKFQSNTPKLIVISSTGSPQALEGKEVQVPKASSDYEFEDTRKGCSPKQPLDIAFVVDQKQGGTAIKMKLWKFVRNIISNLNVDEGDIGIHLITECAEVPELHLNEFDTKSDIMGYFDSIRPIKGQTAGLLRAMTKNLTEANTESSGNDVLPATRHKVGVYITDGKSDDLYSTLREAQSAKLDNDIELFAVGVTKDVDPVELNAMVSCETDDHLYNVPTHSNLHKFVKVLSHRLCELPL